jgi:chromosome segregation ATPase
MTEHVPIRCPRCRKSLRVRTDYLGRRVQCKSCGETFVAVQSAADEAPPSDRVSPPRSAETEALRSQLEQARFELGESRRRIEALEAERDRQSQSHALAEKELQSLREQRETERAEWYETLDAERRDAVSERDRQRHELGEALREAEDRARKLEAAEAELQSLRPQIEAQERASLEQVRGLTDEVERLRGEAETFRAAGEANTSRLSAELEQARSALSAADDERRTLGEDLAESRRSDAHKARRIAELDSQLRSLKEVTGRPDAPERLLPPRPEPAEDADSGDWKPRLERWLEQARLVHEEMRRQADALESEIQAGRSDLELLNRDLALGDWDELDFAFPFEES